MDGLRVAKIDGVVLGRTTREPPHTKLKVTGTLHLTPHHLFFSPAPAHDPAAAAATSENNDGDGDKDASHPAASEEVWIPYPTIVQFQRLPMTKDGYPLQVATKTFDNYTLWFARDREGGAEDVWQSVRDCAVVQSVEQLYAFFYTLPKSPVAAANSSQLSASPKKQLSTDNPLSPLSASPERPTAIHAAAPPSDADGWGCYNVRNEFARQGLGTRTKAWRFTDINKDYTFCPTYPAKLVVPSRISDSVLAYAAKYRSKGRIPALTYLHWANHASITRSSQPMVGIKNARSAQDERLVECIFMSHLNPDSALALSPSPSHTPPPQPGSPVGGATSSPHPHVFGATATNLIIDARPTTNAMANVAKGAGTENMDWYRFGKKAYLGIDNIHVMRSSLRSITDALAESDASGLPVDRDRLRKSGWLKHLTSILEGSLGIVRNVHVRASHVLIHCSDGWDRTAQLSAVAQLCLDPYFRTLAGFRVLVEKDWLSFGHMFCQRSGHLSSTKLFNATPADLDAEETSETDDFGNAVKGAQAFFASVQKQFASNSHLKEVSPVFHQFLDCVRQLQRQFPHEFEFSEDFLLDLHYHLYACQFGTFLFDNEKQRRTQAGAGKSNEDRTTSVWAWTSLAEQRERYANRDYKPDQEEKVLFPEPRDVVFWHRLFKRGDEEMNAPVYERRERERSDRERSERERTERERERRAEASEPGRSERTESGRTETEGTFLAAPSPLETERPLSPREGSHTSLSSVPGTPSARVGAGGWSWGSVRSGALSAFNTFKASASDALQRLNDEDDWAAKGYAEGTGIGEGVRAPLESNPWDTPAAGRKVETGDHSLHTASNSHISALHTSNLNSLHSASSASSAQPRRQHTDLSANPWDDAPATRSLADLTLHEATKPRPAASSTANSDNAPSAQKHPTDEEMALGGSKAWDPLGAA